MAQRMPSVDVDWFRFRHFSYRTDGAETVATGGPLSFVDRIHASNQPTIKTPGKQIMILASPYALRQYAFRLSTESQSDKDGNSLLLLPESKKTDTGNFDDLESDTWNISLGLSTSTETGDEDFVVLVGEVQATSKGSSLH